MTRAEIRIDIGGFRVATLFQNSDADWGYVKGMVKKAFQKEGYGEMICEISSGCDCIPTLNVSYIYCVNLKEKSLIQFDVNVKKYKGELLYTKGKSLRGFSVKEVSNDV